MNDIQKRAQAKWRRIHRAQKSPRFQRVLGRFVGAGLLQTNLEGIERHGDPVPLDDCLWAGEIEPRIFELLPAIALKRPSMLTGLEELPDDLADVLRAVRRHELPPPFRGVEPDKYLQWVPRVGHRGKSPSLLKSFRFRPEDLELLRRLKQSLPAKSETEVLRIALRTLERLHA